MIAGPTRRSLLLAAGAAFALPGEIRPARADDLIIAEEIG